MSHTYPTAASSSNTSNFQIIFNNALKVYQTRTRNDLLLHPLAAQLQICGSPSSILAVLKEKVQDLDRSRSGDERWAKWFDPTVNVLFAFSATLGSGVGLLFSPATVIFAGIGVLLSAAKDVQTSKDTLLDIFERIEMFFRRLEIYTEVPPTTEMTDIFTQIMVEVLSILGMATKGIKQGWMKKYVKRLIGRSDMEDVLKRLDKLSQEEARMVVAQILKVTHTVDEGQEASQIPW
ncbi:hypothetical protein BJV77DRAFT_1073894 [Russula vinacea]|nr:hypothetical protein BJV77DRAFT_1073894 [Russula vinacea]